MRDIKEIIERYLCGEATLKERELLHQWFETDEDLDQWIAQEIECEGMAMDPEVQNRVLESLQAQIALSQRKRKPRRPVLRYFLSIAAMIIGVAIAGSVWYWTSMTSNPSQLPLHISTSVGDHTSINLPDGTVVKLNSCTQVKYSFDKATNQRIAYLSGEAYFDVAPDKDHPFIVKAGEVNVECLGTEFDVNAYPGEADIQVILAQGKVKVSSHNQFRTLEPGMMAVCDRSKASIVVSHVDTQKYTSWINGHLAFNDEPLNQVADRMARIYGVKVIISDASLSSQRFTGNVGKVSLRDFLDILQLASDIKYTIDNDSIVVLYK